MKTKTMILAAALALGALFAGRAEAFTLVELGCHLCDPAVLSSVSDPAAKATLEECCKCHAPCTVSGGASSIDPAFASCFKNKETCPNGCKTDAECPDPVANDCKGRKCNAASGLCEDTVIPNCPPPPCDKTPPPSECIADSDCKTSSDSCMAPHCNKAIGDAVCPDGTKWGFTVGKCGPETPIAGCVPKSCSDKYSDPDAIKCCEMGFDADPAKFKCCRKHLFNHEDPGTPANPKPCGGPETCPKCPNCPPPPVIDCSVIADPAMKSCCQAKGGMLYFVMAACAKTSDDCNIIVNVAGDVNGQLNICCNVLNNTGTITDSTITQACSNTTTGGGPGGATTGSGTGTPTTPASLGTCEVRCKDVDCKIAVDKAGQGVGWLVTYSPPPDVGPVATAVLKQLEGPALTPEEPAGAGGALSIKTITDPSNLPPFVVYTPRPTSMMGEYLPKFKVAVQLNDLSDHELATLTCEQQTALEAKGGGSGCGCAMTAQMATKDQLFAYGVMTSLLIVPALILRRAKKAAKKS